MQEERFVYNRLLDEEITEIVRMAGDGGIASLVDRLKGSNVASEIERKRVQTSNRRPNQARFRRAVLGEHPRCVITNVTMPEVLEAAHIVPFKYHGEDSIANGLCMRLDIHLVLSPEQKNRVAIDSRGEILVSYAPVAGEVAEPG